MKPSRQNLTATVFRALKSTILQLGIFILICEIFECAYAAAIGETKSALAFGIQLCYAKYLFAVLALINGFMKELFAKDLIKFLGAALCFSIWAVYWSSSFSTMPYRSGLVLHAGLASLLFGTVTNFERKVRLA